KLDPICDAYEKAWLKDERPRIEDFLARVEKSAQPNLLRELLLLEIEYRSRSGETLGVDEYVDRFPDDAELVRQWAAREFARLAGAISPATAPQLLGDYELLETLGAGGMGVVYRAKQRSANREVALKVIRSDRIAPQHDGTPAPATERFWTEAQAAARLEHEGIVTVYDVGEVEGQPFFSMRLVDGQSLGDMLRDGPLGNDAAAKYLRDVARAIEEAHRQGILHRDLKPQNVLIDAKTDRALVADFGLAKMIEDDSELTRHGEVMGTPQYMSPEQARDASTVSTAADIYSTGATMYHALTGRPPFLAASAMDTVQQVINEEPLPPRRLNRAIDRDLETICLKCLEKDPPRRYQTSAEVADELHRFLERQPIRARPVGVAGHVWRWSRRKPALAAMSLVALLLAIAAATGIGVGYRRSEAARQSTAAGFADASLALDNFVNEIRGDERLNSPELRPLKEELLRRAVQYYEQFLAKRAADENLSSQVARTYYQVGLIYEDIATTEQAQTAYERAADLQRKRVAAQPGGVELLAQTGDTLNALGRVYVKTAQAPRAEATLQECIATRESAVRLADANTHPLRRQFRRQLANSHMNLGILKKNLDDPSGALQQYQAAQGFRLQLLDEDQNDLNSRRDLGIGYYN
ncbi:MAG: serine/threonine-protein kinase, partial [Pirellulaceae bacterium]|nr:serine/threonine-protein kinase [Pirellulaceae bacterium]